MKLSAFRITLIGLAAMLALAGLLQKPAPEEAKANDPGAKTELVQISQAS